MKKYTIHIIYISIILILSVWLYKRITDEQKVSIPIVDYSKKIDSLELIILNKNTIFELQRDSINNIINALSTDKQNIINHYEIKYKNYSNVNIISDDSIITYISNKIHNK